MDMKQIKYIQQFFPKNIGDSHSGLAEDLSLLTCDTDVGREVPCILKDHSTFIFWVIQSTVPGLF
jgi:hypothetical protein